MTLRAGEFMGESPAAMLNPRYFALVSLGALAFACGTSAGSSSGFGDAGDGTSSGASGTSGTSGLTSSGSSEAGADGCSEAAKLVYVISDGGQLYSFKPDTLTFTKIGTIDCAGSGGAFNSMAVDRSGTAWVNAQNGNLYKVSTADASCQSTAYVPNQGGFGRYGMAFVSDAKGSKEETLYVAHNSDIDPGGGNGLGKIDLGTLKLTVLGDYGGSVSKKGAELTGTGDGQLFGFFTTQPATLAEIDKTTAKASGFTSLASVSTGLAFAFSFWGGDFWFYTSQGAEGSNVTRLKAATDKSLSVVKTDVGFRIVGAGVSTCAPTTPPK